MKADGDISNNNNSKTNGKKSKPKIVRIREERVASLIDRQNGFNKEVTETIIKDSVERRKKKRDNRIYTKLIKIENQIKNLSVVEVKTNLKDSSVQVNPPKKCRSAPTSPKILNVYNQDK